MSKSDFIWVTVFAAITMFSVLVFLITGINLLCEDKIWQIK